MALAAELQLVDHIANGSDVAAAVVVVVETTVLRRQVNRPYGLKVHGGPTMVNHRHRRLVEALDHRDLIIRRFNLPMHLKSLKRNHCF